MEKYIGVKLIEAEPMTRSEYNKFRGWTITADLCSNDEGYKIEYPDNYISWCPKEVFENSNRTIENMTFGYAIEAMKIGKKVARQGWNGKGIMFVVYQKGYPQGIPCNKQTADAWGMNEGDLFICRPYLQIKCADGTHAMWNPSTSDVLEEDWYIVD